jgi:hypothetical protein
VVPPGVVIDMFCGPKGAAVLMLKVAPMLPPLVPVLSMPTPGIGEIVVLPDAKFVPDRVTFVSLPRTPKVGVIDASVGIPGNTVNTCAPLIPLGVATVTL